MLNRIKNCEESEDKIMKETITAEQTTLENLRSRLSKLKEDLGLAESVDIITFLEEAIHVLNHSGVTTGYTMGNISILLPVKPEWLVKILNGEKIIDVRKTMPKCDLPIDVYLYCCKSKKKLFFDKVYNKYMYGEDTPKDRFNSLNGKVVAKFTLNKVDDLSRYAYNFKDNLFYEILNKACVNTNYLQKYTKNKPILFAWYIDNLQVFDNPITLDENDFGNPKTNIAITKAPQSWCYCIYDKTGFMPF